MKVPAIIILLLIQIPFTKGQAWIKKKGDYYGHFSLTQVAGKRLYSSDGTGKWLHRNVRDISFQGYYETGLLPNLMVSASILPKYVATSSAINDNGFFSDTLESGRSIGLGNSYLSIIYGISQKGPIVVSLQNRLELPQVSPDKSEFGLQTGTNALGFAPIINVGYSNSTLFSLASFGPNFRTNNYSEQLIGNFQLGAKMGRNDQFWIITRFDLQKSLYNGNYDDGSIHQTGLYTNNQEFMSYGLTFGYEFAYNMSSKEEAKHNDYRWTLWLNLGGGILGTDVLKSPAISLAISKSLNKS